MGLGIRLEVYQYWIISNIVLALTKITLIHRVQAGSASLPSLRQLSIIILKNRLSLIVYMC